MRSVCVELGDDANGRLLTSHAYRNSFCVLKLSNIDTIREMLHIATDGEYRMKVEQHHNGTIISVDISGAASIWSVDGQLLRKFTIHHDSALSCICVLRDGRIVVNGVVCSNVSSLLLHLHVSVLSRSRVRSMNILCCGRLVTNHFDRTQIWEH